MQGSLSGSARTRSSANYPRVQDAQNKRARFSSAAKPEESETMLGPEARAQRISDLSATERPFAVGGSVKAWLDEASTPLEDSPAASSTVSWYEEGAPSQGPVIGDRGFDIAAEEHAKQFQTALEGNIKRSQRPSASSLPKVIVSAANCFSHIRDLSFLQTLQAKCLMSPRKSFQA